MRQALGFFKMVFMTGARQALGFSRRSSMVCMRSPRLAETWVTRTNWPGQELRLGGAKHSMREKTHLAHFQPVDVIYIASVATDTKHNDRYSHRLAPVPPKLKVGVFPCAEGLCQIA